jgi:hypothetical protein
LCRHVCATDGRPSARAARRGRPKYATHPDAAYSRAPVISVPRGDSTFTSTPPAAKPATCMIPVDMFTTDLPSM